MTSFVLQKNMETNGAQLHVDTLAFVQHPFSYFFPLDLTSPPVTWRQCYPREKEPQTFVRLHVGAPMKTFSSLVLQAAADHCALGWDCTWKKATNPATWEAIWGSGQDPGAQGTQTKTGYDVKQRSGGKTCSKGAGLGWGEGQCHRQLYLWHVLILSVSSCHWKCYLIICLANICSKLIGN